VGIFSTITRVAAGVATGGLSEAARAAGVPNVTERVFTGGIGPEVPLPVKIAAATFAATGDPFSSVVALQGATPAPSGQAVFVGGPTTVFAPSKGISPGAGGGSQAFSSFTLPQGGGGNPAWRSLGSSAVSSRRGSMFLRVGQECWEARGNSVRRC